MHDQLAARHHDRYRCDIPIRLIVHPDHAQVVVLSKRVQEADGGVCGTLLDMSLAGFGVRVSICFPRACKLIIVAAPLIEGAYGRSEQFTFRVQRTTMMSRDPSFLVGTMLVAEGDGAEVSNEQVERMRQFASRLMSA